MWPPSLLVIRLGRKRGVPLPVPVFVLWPIALILWVLGLPVRLLARIWPAAWLRYASFGLRSIGLVWYTRGLRVRVRGRNDSLDFWFL
jgi:hypothetical protein